MIASFKRWPSSLRCDVLGAQLLLNVLGLAVPIATLQIYDRVLKNGAANTLVVLAALAATAVLLEFVVRVVQGILKSAVAARFDHRTTLALSWRLLHGDRTVAGRTTAGSVMEDFHSVQSVKDFYYGTALNSVVEVPFVFIYLLLIAIIAGPLVAVPVLIIAVAAAWAYSNSKSALDTQRTQQESDRRRYDFLLEVLRGTPTIKALALEGPIARRYERLRHASAQSHQTITDVVQQTANVSNTLSVLATVLVVAAGAILAATGQITLGALAATTMLTARAVQPVVRGLSAATRYQSARDAIQFVNGIETSQDGDEKTLSLLPSGPLGIGLQNVVLNDDAHEATALEIAPGETIALLGANSAENTQWLRVMNGTVKPLKGLVLVGGADAGDIGSAEYGQKVAYIPSDAPLFSASIRENLACFGVEERFRKAQAILSEIGAHQDIIRMTRGYETEVSEGSPLLNTGLRQSIAIARALAVAPGAVLLDETNKGMDLGLDQRLSDYLRRIKGSVTMVLVTERPSYLRLADRIFQSEGGCLKDVTEEYRARFAQRSAPAETPAVRKQITQIQKAVTR